MIIYQIRNLANEFLYIGKSKYNTVEERYAGNWWERTHNKYLKEAVKFYGLNSFEVSFLETDIADEKILAEKEYAHIQAKKCLFPNGYNFFDGIQYHENYHDHMCKGWTIKDLNSGEIFEVKNLMEFCRKNKIGFSRMSDVLNGKRNYVVAGRYTRPELTWDIINRLKYGVYLLRKPDETIIEVVNLKDFCDKNQLDSHLMGAVTQGVSLQHRGWSMASTPIERLIRYKNSSEVLVDRENNEYPINNVQEFCGKFKLKVCMVNALLNEKYIEYKGFRLKKTPLEKVLNKNVDLSRVIVMSHPEHGEKTFSNIERFCKENKLNPPTVREVINRKNGRLSHKGWTLVSDIYL